MKLSGAALALTGAASASVAMPKFPSYDWQAFLQTYRSAPAYVRNAAACQDLRLVNGRGLDRISKAHDACLLAEDAGGSGPLPIGGQQCEKPKCQQLHNARTRYEVAVRQQFLACEAKLRFQIESEQARKSHTAPR